MKPEAALRSHTFSDFRVTHAAWLHGVPTASGAGLTHAGLVTLERMAPGAHPARRRQPRVDIEDTR